MAILFQLEALYFGIYIQRFISNRFINNLPSNDKLISNFQGSPIFHLATIKEKTTDQRKLEFFI